jgi:hypothetical protein
MKLELEIDVPESRQVTLPPEVPVGKVTLTVQTPFDPFSPLPHTSDKFERERAAFFRLLPELLKTHSGKVVAIHDEQVIAVGDEPVAVATEVYKKVGYVALYVQRVLEKQPVYRLKTPREIGREES